VLSKINILKSNKYYVKINIKNVYIYITLTLTIYKQIVEAYFLAKLIFIY